jgi:hypothetical protein
VPVAQGTATSGAYQPPSPHDATSPAIHFAFAEAHAIENVDALADIPNAPAQ